MGIVGLALAFKVMCFAGAHNLHYPRVALFLHQFHRGLRKLLPQTYPEYHRDVALC